MWKDTAWGHAQFRRHSGSWAARSVCRSRSASRAVSVRPEAGGAQAGGDACEELRMTNLDVHRTESDDSPIDSEFESSVKPIVACQQRDEFGQSRQTEGIDEQRLAAGRCCLSVEWRPVGPFARNCERAQLDMAQAQSLDA